MLGVSSFIRSPSFNPALPTGPGKSRSETRIVLHLNHRAVTPSLALLLTLAITSVARAGIGPENVIVVVNADSTVSRTIANHYVEARAIPSINVVMLSGVPEGLMISLEDFKAKILTPLLTELNSRGISRQARVIAYSADFPTSVDVSSHRAKVEDANVKKYQSGRASLNGATFFFRFMLADRSEYLNWGANMYARGRFERYFANQFTGDHKVAFDTAVKDLAEGRYAEAAQAYVKLFAEFPTMSALAIKAGEAFAKADQRDQAVQMIGAAIKSGWWSARYLKEDETLSALLDDEAIAKALPLLRTAPTTLQGPVGFATDRGWTGSGQPIKPDQGGVNYLLSCALAVVHERGSTVEQAVAVLKRAADADRTHPKAEFRFAANSDVRAKTRSPNVGDALVYLADAGYQANVFRADLPTTAGDVVGLMVGRATVKLADQPWRLVPGAIAENLTSFGGAYHINGHTKVTEFLHAGAAMSSGTVAEPYALQFKFPLPIMYGYYADGVSAIEAFYLSVSSPYQLLIVGDPICQPFARPPNDWIDISLGDDLPRKVVMSRRSLNVNVPHTSTRLIELYVGGRLVRATAPAKFINLDLPKDASGVLDVRATLVGNDPTEPRISFARQIDLAGPLATPTARVTEARTADSTTLKVSLECPGADSIELMHFGKPVAAVKADHGVVTFDAKPLGDGPLRFRPLARFGDQTVLGMTIVTGNEDG